MSPNPPNTSRTSSEDMPISFLTLPRELRDKIYELCLLLGERIRPFDDYWDEELAYGLLLVNKTINREASMILYQNRFDFTNTTHEGLTSFLENIGRNVDYIRHVYIDFPTFRNLEVGTVAIEDDDSSILATIQSNCVNLKTLTTSRRSTDLMESRLDDADNLNIVTEALALVDTRFRAILSLQEIIVMVHEDAPSDYIRRRIEGQGWTVIAKENSYDYASDGSFEDDWDRYDDHYSRYFDNDDDDDNNEEYDYEYDSDFWRRAAD
ncbi:hypothetical protein V495_03742 [Pseudogymnoascus sp. VKM F-4514 (FW-929)]|nr:hypothetical protein V495_03742 [Pseudogymnoascus sp. VKM F-4514 (FW-929)]KFY61491.1 hypothetical protein V497_02935 [Pseudogymnoascus sp. VKM F-4516 (FW-969)]